MSYQGLTLCLGSIFPGIIVQHHFRPQLFMVAKGTEAVGQFLIANTI